MLKTLQKLEANGSRLLFMGVENRARAIPPMSL